MVDAARAAAMPTAISSPAPMSAPLVATTRSPESSANFAKSLGMRISSATTGSTTTSSPTISNVSSGASNFDPAWYTDSGATDHITGELDKLNVREQYSGKDQVHTASGSGMKITHVGKSVIRTPSGSFQLKEVLHVPHTTKNLCAVGRLTTNNNVSVEYFPNSFVIKDLATRRVLFQGPSEGGLYPISGGSSSRQALSSTRLSRERWHCRLGHPSSPVVDQVVTKSGLRCDSKPDKTSVCDACHQGKSHQLPYPRSNRVSSAPLKLIFFRCVGACVPI